MAAPSLISSRMAATVTDPALPLPVERAVICGPEPDSTISEPALTETLPPGLPRLHRRIPPATRPW
jgi:hypothetical protein